VTPDERADALLTIRTAIAAVADYDLARDAEHAAVALRDALDAAEKRIEELAAEAATPHSIVVERRTEERDTALARAEKAERERDALVRGFKTLTLGNLHPFVPDRRPGDVAAILAALGEEP
jgi:hypothetical protein